MLTTCKDHLVNKLDMVARIVPTRTTIPILENIVLRVTDKFTILANNMEIYINTVVSAMILEEGDVAVNGKLFSGLIRKLPDNEQITIKTDSKKHSITITAGKANVSLPYIDAKTYPEPPNTDEKNSVIFCVNGQIFRNKIKNTIYAASKKEDNSILSSMNLVLKNNKLYVCSLDGRRVAKNYITFTKKSNKCVECNIIVPLYTCQEILKIKHTELEITVTNNHIIIRSDDFLMISSLISGKFYDISKIATKSQLSVQVPKEQLEESINRTLILADEKTPLRIRITKSEMVLNCQSKHGLLTETIEILGNNNKTPLEIGFNPLFLLDAIKAMEEEQEHINLNFENATSPCFIKNENNLHLVLPVALKAVATA